MVGFALLVGRTGDTAGGDTMRGDVPKGDSVGDVPKGDDVGGGRLRRD